MRIRALKPGFFKNEDLCELSPWHRICFEGLWCCADREGRLQDRPKRLKAEIYPYDDLDMNGLLWDLAHAGFIVRYAVAGQPFIQVTTFDKHQHPRQDEAPSAFPPYAVGTERRNGPDSTTFPAALPASLLSDGLVTPARSGSGDLDLGSGDLGPGDTAAAAAAPRDIRAQDLLDLWNATTRPPIPRCRELTDDRRRKIRQRLAKRPSLTEWREVFEAVQANRFNSGDGPRGWVMDFDYIIKNDTVAAKALERARTSSAPSRPAWDCHHDERCGSEARCDFLTRLAAEKAKAS